MGVLTILGRSASINVRKVLWLCRELDLDYRHEPWGSGSLSTADPRFLVLNPNGMIPVIVDDGFVLWESNTICRYLARRQGRDDLLPADRVALARVEQWMDWQGTELNAAWRYAFMALVRHSAAHADHAAIESSIADWNRCMRILDAQLARTGAHVAGAAFTLADIVLGLSTVRWRMTPMLRPVLPAVDRWFDQLRQHEGFLMHGDNGVP